MDLGLAGRRAVVTGGSKGIGKAIAAELMAEGVAVVPSWVPHGAWTTDSHCVEIDVFCPPRQSLLKLAEAQGAGVSTAEQSAGEAGEGGQAPGDGAGGA